MREGVMYFLRRGNDTMPDWLLHSRVYQCMGKVLANQLVDHVVHLPVHDNGHVDLLVTLARTLLQQVVTVCVEIRPRFPLSVRPLHDHFVDAAGIAEPERDRQLHL